MKEKLNKKTLGIIVLLFLAVFVGWFASNSIPKAKGEAPPGMRATDASTSQITIPGNTALLVFASSTCISRIITSAPAQLWISLTDLEEPPVPGRGHLQNASTTAAYDAGIYGCGLWRIYNSGASTSVFTITQFFDFR